jgi:Cu(I)/Ag(I) efflux system membrane fusion protein
MRASQPATTTVSEDQASDLTLTTTAVAEQNIQSWVRTSATIDASGKALIADLDEREAEAVAVGQRARAFQVSSRSSMFQARVTKVTKQGSGVRVEVTLTAQGPANGVPYLLEIVVDRGRFLAIPNAAIIEEGGTHIVYVQLHPGHYVPAEVHTGLQGELYTEVLHGLEAGQEVVTFGSFFVDADYKLKSSGGESMAGHEHHHH